MMRFSARVSPSTTGRSSARTRVSRRSRWIRSSTALLGAAVVGLGPSLAQAIPLQSAPSVHALIETRPLEQATTDADSASSTKGLSWTLASLAGILDLWPDLIGPEGVEGADEQIPFAFGLGAAGGAPALLGNADVLGMVETRPPLGSRAFLPSARFVRLAAVLAAAPAAASKVNRSSSGGTKSLASSSLAPVPEPGSTVLFTLGIGLVGLALFRRRKTAQSQG